MKILNYKVSVGTWHHATFDVYLDKAGLVLRRFKLCKSKNGHWFASAPQFKGQEDEKYISYFEWTDGEKKRDFEKEVMKALEEDAKLSDTHSATLPEDPLPF